MVWVSSPDTKKQAVSRTTLSRIAGEVAFHPGPTHRMGRPLSTEAFDTTWSRIAVSSLARHPCMFASERCLSGRVGAAATRFFEQLQACAGAPSEDGDRLHRKLGWAAQLHEIGFLVSHGDYHRHGAYVLEHADAPGFATPELHRLGLLVLGHRGKLRKLEAELSDAAFAQQLLALRLAVILCHARRDPDLDGLQLSAKPGQPGRKLSCRAGWADAFPQSAHLLREEAAAWNKTPWPLQLQGL